MEGKFKCPSCGECTDVPKGDITEFSVNVALARQVEIASYELKMSSGEKVACDRCVKRPNGFAVVFCCKCCLFLCLSCKEDHEWCRETVKHELVKIGGKETFSKTNGDGNKLFSRKPLFCSKHQEEKLKFYCKQCQILTCRDCIIINHREHSISDHEAVAETGKDEIRESICGSTEIVQCLEKVIDQGEEMIEKITTRRREVEEFLQVSFDEVVKAVETRKESLINEATTIADDKISVIQKQLENFRKLKDDFVFAAAFAKDALENQPLSELLSSKKIITDRIQSTVTKYNKESKVIGENDFIFSYFDATALTAKIESLGSVAPFDLCNVTAVFESGFAIPLATVNVERKFSISLYDTKGSKITSDISASNYFLVTLEDSNGQKTKIINFTPSNSIISFSCIPKMCGQHYLSIMMNGSHLRSSPFRLSVNNPKNYSSLVNERNFNINGPPYGVAVHTNGDVYVSDCSNGCIKVFSSNGTQKQTFGSQGSGNKQFNSPNGLLILNDILYICDNGNHRIQKWSLNGEYVDQFGTYGTGDGQLSSPWGITHNGKDQIIVADRSNKRVQVFDTNGSFIKKIDCEGYNSSDVAVALYYNADKVSVFSSAGQRITT